MLIKDIIQVIEDLAPLHFQEDYDNSGLIIGNKLAEAKGAILTLDCTEAVIEEAIQCNCNLIIAHHPILFRAVKKLTGQNYIERTLIKAIQNNIAIYACHTNLDNVQSGVNLKIAEKLGLSNLNILAPKNNLLKKLVSFVPELHCEAVLSALYASGAGNIGNYDACSFRAEGYGTFRGNEHSQPFIGVPGQLTEEKELRIEVIYNVADEKKIIEALLKSHPYEEVAYDLYQLDNQHSRIGSGMLGNLNQAMKEADFLKLVKNCFKVPFIRHTHLTSKTIQKVAICGGSGQFLLKNALNAGAEAFITSDFKYHDFFDVEGKLLLLDIGHYESEQFTPEIFYELIQKYFPTFAIRLSKINTNPVNYF